MSAPGAWLGTPVETPTDDDVQPLLLTSACDDPDCGFCVVTAAGARALCEVVGVDYDTLDAEHQVHYRTICGEVMAAMSDAMLSAGLVRPTEGGQ